MILLPIAFALASITSSSPDILRDHIDNSVKPGTDFFQYANGAWFKENPIPSSESGWGIANLVRDELYARLRAVNDRSVKANAPEGSDSQKVGNFWVAAMDEEKAEQVGMKPLQEELDRISAVASVRNALDEGFRLQELGVGVFFDVGVGQDEKQSDEMTIYLSQGGLGLDRDYYFNPEPGVAKVRDEYAKYVQDTLALTGVSEGPDEAKNMVAFETALAKVSRKLADLRDDEKNYNKMLLSDVEGKLDPSIPWTEELSAWHLKPTNVVVGQPEFFTGLESILATTPPAELRSYLRFHLVNRFAAYLTKKADDLHFGFFNRDMGGQKIQQPRWKRALSAENSAIGFILGRNFVKEYFPPESKKKYSDLIEEIRSAYHKRIDNLTWMTPGTKAKAHEKLAALVKKVGYPDHWKDYSALKIGRNSFCENMMNAARWRFHDEVSKYGKPVDRSEWGITPQTFNAYYNPSNNEIVMPAAAFAIPGMKDSEIDEPLMYGNAAASWIGHEMTHGFDDQGRHFDAKGNLVDWWTKEDADQFDQQTQLMVKQFDGYEPIPGLHINGSATLGENIADYGGLLLGIDAFKQSKSYKEGKKIGGLTPMQQFFLGYNLSWLREDAQQATRRQLLGDVHAPAKWRVNGPLSNIPEFYDAFGIKEGDPMWRAPASRPHIW